jgi:hypothetical protein
MTWNSTWPLGTVSVRANRITGQDNTTYIKSTMGGVPLATNLAGTTDHFWDVAAGLNGHHRFVKFPDYAADPLIDNVSIRGVAYAKTVSVANTRIELFYKNNEGVYQVSPSYQTGTVAINGTGNIQTLFAVPANCYGEIFFTKDSDPSLCCQGIFSSSGSQTRGFTLRVRSTILGSFDYAIELLNDAAGGLNLRCNRGDGSSSTDGNWTWKATYRAI